MSQGRPDTLGLVGRAVRGPQRRPDKPAPDRAHGDIGRVCQQLGREEKGLDPLGEGSGVPSQRAKDTGSIGQCPITDLESIQV